MLILHLNTNHSSSTLPLPQVQELLVRGLTQERSTAYAGIQNPEKLGTHLRPWSREGAGQAPSHATSHRQFTITPCVCLRRYTWDSQKKKLQHYKRRQPEASALYQIVFHGHEELPYVWESRFQHQYGCLRDEVIKTLAEYLNCGILAHGAARVYCDGCKHSLLVAFSCKRRGVCPSCGAKRAVKFAEHIFNEVIEDVPHRHTVFTIPKRLKGVL